MKFSTAILLFTLVVAVIGKTRDFNPAGGLTELYSTGVDSNGQVLPSGSQDPHWFLSGLVFTGGQVDSTPWPSMPELPAPLYVVDNQVYNGRPGPCSDTTTTHCVWVSPSPSASTALPGSWYYYFQTNFLIDNRANLDTASFQLTISAADVVKAILINGVDTAAVAGSSDANRLAFLNNGPDSYTTFVFDNTYGELRKGINTLEVVVEHAFATPVAFSLGVLSGDSSFTPVSYPTVGGGNVTCDQFNIYVPGTPLPDGYQDLTDILPNIVLDQEGKVTLPCPPSLSADGLFVPLILSVQYSYYGEPVCAVIVDCNVAGVGQIFPTVTNVGRGQSLTFVAEELCSNPGVFFGCIDSAYGSRLSPARQGASGTVLTGEFADTIEVSYTDPYGFSSNSYQIFLTCGNQPYWSFDLISSLLLRDAFNRSIEKLVNLREKILNVQGLLFDNVENIPCEEIGQATDLSQTALSFFNFLDCLGNRELSEDAFLYSTDQIKATLPLPLCPAS